MLLKEACRVYSLEALCLTVNDGVLGSFHLCQPKTGECQVCLNLAQNAEQQSFLVNQRCTGNVASSAQPINQIWAYGRYRMLGSVRKHVSHLFHT